jgi:type IV secretory pathway TraG/TraD family ATPase VirD4
MRRWTWARAARWSLGLGVLFLCLGWADRSSGFGVRLLVLGVVLLIVPIAIWARRAFGSSRRTAARIERRSRRNDGVASRWALWRTSGRFAMRRRMRALKPSTRQMSLFERVRVPTLEFAAPVARVGWQRIWTPCEDVVVMVGGPRTGKSGAVAGRILDAPGAVIATSTRTDLLELTGPVRSRIGPVWVFNPSGLARLDSTIVFDPLVGCENAKTATARATDMLSGAEGPGTETGGDRAFWQGQAVRVLSGLMHAAALGGASMTDVQRWVSSPDEHANEVQRYLRMSKHESIRVDALQFVTTNDRTRSSITSTIMPALGWLNDEDAARAAGQGGQQPGPALVDGELQVTERAGFDVAELLASRGAVYLLGAEDSQVAPLVCALTGHIARTARQLASEMPGGRLDPSLTLVLDEAALISPIPLDKWSSDMGGRNITIHIAVQSRAQLRQRWGDTGAAAILNNAATLLVFGGGRDTDDLVVYSTLAGERHEKTRVHDPHGRLISTATQRVAVLHPAQIAQLGFGRVVIFRRGMASAIGQVEMAWKRHDVRVAARQDRRAARREQRRTVWADRRAVWAVRWAEFRAALDQALTAFATWVDRLGESRTTSVRDADGEVNPDA